MAVLAAKALPVVSVVVVLVVYAAGPLALLLVAAIPYQLVAAVLAALTRRPETERVEVILVLAM